MPRHPRSPLIIVLTLLLLGGMLLTPAPTLAATGSGAAPATVAPTGMSAPEDLAASAGSRLKLAAVLNHGCRLVEDGSVRCWGNNRSGQLGDGTTTDRSAPVTVAGLSGVVSISAGGNHSCAVLSDGSVRCWGRNRYGQLGDGTTANRSVPVVVAGISTAVSITAGMDHTCAALSDGTARCWGNNESGQLGNGTIDQGATPTPAPVSELSGVVSISAGWYHTCAVLGNRTARCWGNNESGQLGDGSTTRRLTPVTVGDSTPLAGVVELHGGIQFSCALLVNGTARCWGSNQYSQLGDGSSTNSPLPVTVGGGTPLRQISSLRAGGGHACALLGDGTARCWGANNSGQLGNGTTTNSPLPVTVGGPLTNIAAIATGSGHSCAVLADSSMRCWGGNFFGQLGDGTVVHRSSPVAVLGIGALANKAVQITVRNHSCALLSGGTVRCWGWNGAGQLGDGTTTSRSTPVAVSGLTNVVAISAGAFHTCALRADGIVHCWGVNSSGQLGDGTTTSRSTAVAVSGLTNVVAISVGAYHTCAMRAERTIHCWGSNQYGQLGDGTTTNRLTPVTVGLSLFAVALSVGERHTCVLLSDSGVRCAGFNAFGELGNGTTDNSSIATAVSGLGNVMAISAGRYRSCAIIADGSARCWGLNNYGQLGDGTTTNRSTPTPVSGLANVVDIAHESHHTCALLSDGSVRCWGSNLYGQLGDGTTIDRYTPTLLSGLANAVDIAAGDLHSCAIRSNGAVSCWGDNQYGQLGDGTTAGRLTPVPVRLEPLLSISGGSVAEGNAGTVSLNFQVALSYTSASTVTVNYATSDGSATAGSDYTATSGTLTFAPGQTSQVIPVPVSGDVLYEANETVRITLASPSGANLDTSSATGTILNDDGPPNLTLAGGTVLEGASGPATLVFTATLSAASAVTATAEYATQDGSATAGADYAATSGTLRIPAGQLSGVITVPVSGDTLYEADETLSVTLASPSGANLDTSSATGTILNDDSPPNLTLAGGTVLEGDSGPATLVFTATLSAASAVTATAEYATQDGSATAGADYAATSGTLTFAPGQTSQVIPVTVSGDTLYEADETVTVSLSSPSGANLDTSSATGTILNDDGPPNLALSGGAVLEGDSGAATLVFTATLSAASAVTATAEYATQDGSATAGADYAATSGTLTFAPGATTTTISVTVHGDSAREADETVRLVLSGATGATLASTETSGTIISDDTAVLVFLPLISNSPLQDNLAGCTPPPEGGILRRAAGWLSAAKC